MIADNIKNQLGELFYGKDNKFFMSDLEKFEYKLKDKNIQISPKDLKDWYNNQEVVQVSRPPPLTKESLPRQHFNHKIITSFPFERLYLDVMYIKKYGIAILTALDQFSRLALAKVFQDTHRDTGITAEKALTGLKEFQTIIKDKFKYAIFKVYTDDGGEFKSVFSKYLKDNQIPHIIANPLNPHKNANIERFNGTLRLLIEKYKLAYGGNITQNVINNLIQSYNNNKHKRLLFTPIEICKNLNNASQQYDQNQEEKKIENELPTNQLQNDTYVRYYTRHAESFKKLGKNWSKTIYQIEEYEPQSNSYTLKDLPNKKFPYEYLQPIDINLFNAYNYKPTIPQNNNQRRRNVAITRDVRDVLNQPIQNERRRRRAPNRLNL
jgi:transposase InsO family protein